MNAFSFSLSLYLLLLACLPCRDMDDCGNAFNATLFNNNTEHNHHDTHDACSPFCNCSCCGQQIICIDFNIISTWINPIAIILSDYNYNSIYFFNFSGKIWQPPRLA